MPIPLDTGAGNRGQVPPATSPLGIASATMHLPGERDMDRWQFNGESPQPGASLDDFNFGSSMPMPMAGVSGNFTWEMIGLGLEEPLPPQETIDELFVSPGTPSSSQTSI